LRKVRTTAGRCQDRSSETEVRIGQDVRTSLRANLGNTTSVPFPPGQPATSLSRVFPGGRRYWRILHRARTPRIGGKAGAALDVVVHNGAGGVRRGRRNCHREIFSYQFSAGMGNDWRPVSCFPVRNPRSPSSPCVQFAKARSRVLDSLRDNAYGMYLIHYAFVSWSQYALLKVALSAFVKGSLAFSATLAMSWGVTAALRRIPAAARVI
jgi:hypothetical protein